MIIQEFSERHIDEIRSLMMRRLIYCFKRNHIPSIKLSLKTNLDNAAEEVFVKAGFQEVYRIFELKI